MRIEIEQNLTPTPLFQDAAAAEPDARSIDTSTLLDQAKAAAKKGDRKHARSLLLSVTETDPRSVDAWLWLASVSEYPEELLGFLNNVLAIEPDHERALKWMASTRKLIAKTFVQRGIDARSDGRNEFALDCLDRALDHDPECESAWFWRASFASDPTERINCLERVLEIDPSNDDARAALDDLNTAVLSGQLEQVRELVASGDYADARVAVENFLASDPRNVDALQLWSQLTTSVDDRINAYRTILGHEPSNAFAKFGFELLSPETHNATSQRTEDAVSQQRPADQDHADADEKLEFEEVSPFEAPAEEPEVPSPFVFDAPDVDNMQADNEHDPQEGSYQAPVDFVYDDRSAVDIIEPAVDEFERELESVPAFGSSPDPDPFEEPDRAGRVAELAGEAFEAPADALTIEATVEPVADHCPYCDSECSSQAFTCNNCKAILSLSDIELILAGGDPENHLLVDAVNSLEASADGRDLDEGELLSLAIGHLNLRNFDRGMEYLREAAALAPNNVVLHGQLNTLAIRLDEMRRQQEVHDAMPRGKNILVVDDSATVRKLISSKLEKCGHNVICAADGVEALELMGEYVPDLVLLDIAMPRMDGYTVCKEIRSNESVRHVPVVMISGKDGFFDKVRGRMAGTTAYITKPFGPETLMRALETYLLPDTQVEHSEVEA